MFAVTAVSEPVLKSPDMSLKKQIMYNQKKTMLNMVIFFFFAVFVIFLSLNLYICIEIKLLRGGEKTAKHREMQITCVQVRLLKKGVT